MLVLVLVLVLDGCGHLVCVLVWNGLCFVGVHSQHNRHRNLTSCHHAIMPSCHHAKGFDKKVLKINNVWKMYYLKLEFLQNSGPQSHFGGKPIKLKVLLMKRPTNQPNQPNQPTNQPTNQPNPTQPNPINPTQSNHFTQIRQQSKQYNERTNKQYHRFFFFKLEIVCLSWFHCRQRYQKRKSIWEQLFPVLKVHHCSVRST